MSPLEQRLRELHVQWPETPDLAAAVLARLEAEAMEPDRAPSRRAWAWRPQVAWIAAALLVAVATAMAVPSARSAILEFLGLDSARIERREPTATPRRAAPLGSDLGLGRRVTLARARAAAGFPVELPRGLGRPDAVYLDRLPLTGRAVHLVYGRRPGVRTSSHTGAAVLVSVFRATAQPLIEKSAGGATRVRRLRVDGDLAYFLEGAHGFALAAPDGESAAFEPQRLAGNTLLVERDGLLVRIEGQVPQRVAVGYLTSP